MLGLRFCARAFSSCGERGPLFITVHGPLTIAASLVVEHRLQTRRLSSCGSRAQLLRDMWDLPRPGLEPASPALAGRFSTTAPPGKPCIHFYLPGNLVTAYVIAPDLFGLNDSVQRQETGLWGGRRERSGPAWEISGIIFNSGKCPGSVYPPFLLPQGLEVSWDLARSNITVQSPLSFSCSEMPRTEPRVFLHLFL